MGRVENPVWYYGYMHMQYRKQELVCTSVFGCSDIAEIITVPNLAL